MPEYLHFCNKCQQEFEDSYSIKADPPTLCPLCGEEGGVKRLISSATAGKVVLEGNELKESIAKDREKLKREMRTNENLKANIVGESNFHRIQTEWDRRK